MTEGILTLLGGIGMFLFGMTTMTDALRALASDRARAMIARFAATPLRGLASGIAITGVVQSSSATMVMTIGFVGAGLLTFAQALGVILGANVGTTITGWIVMVLGLKLQLGTIALPALLAATMTRLTLRGTPARAADVAIGLSLVFIGLDFMQSGLSVFEGRVTPETFPGNDWWGRLQLVAIGVAVTVVTQSSSAGVAAALVLLGAEAIRFEQAAAMVIGLSVGTSFTGLLASIGGSRAMLQTAMSNLLFNFAIGIPGYLLLDLITPVVEPGGIFWDPQLALVLFHTGYKLAGAAVFLPLLGPFSRLVVRLVPERDEMLTAALDRRLLSDPATALDAATTTTRRIAVEMFAAVAAALRPGAGDVALAQARERAQAALDELHRFLAAITVPEGRETEADRYAALLHQFDHLSRLTHRAGQTARIATLRNDPALRRPALVLARRLARHAEGQDGSALSGRRLGWLAAQLEWRENRMRRSLLGRRGIGGLATDQIFARTDSTRWMRRVAVHAGRIVHYHVLARTEMPEPAEPAPSG